MTCKNCIHYELCEKYISYIAAEIGKDDLPSFTNNAEKCVRFIDRSKSIELPCKVGDTVYIHAYNREKAKYEVAIINNILLSEIAVLIEDKENVYTSEKEAEQALRERNNETR